MKHIYENSSFVQKVKKNKKLAFLDVDLTLTGISKIQVQVRERLEALGFAIIFVTSRPYELVLSDEARNKSPTLKRPPAKTEIDEKGNRFHRDLSEIKGFSGLLDPDVIAGTSGLDIYIKQKNGAYLRDTTYKLLDIPSLDWKKKVMHFINEIQKTVPGVHLKKYENVVNYYEHKVDIAPLRFRVQLRFDSITSKKNFLHSLKEINIDTPLYALDDSEPENKKYSVYLFPIPAESIKAEAVDYLIHNVSQFTNIPLINFHVFLAGDSYPDLAMALRSAVSTQSSFFLPGGSRLTECFTDIKLINYIDISISHWKKNLKKIRNGVYKFNNKNIYIGNELFPGKTEAESVNAFLHSPYAKKI